MGLFSPRITAEVASGLVLRHFAPAVEAWCRTPEMQAFVQLVEQRQDVLAQKEYRSVTGTPLNEGFLAVVLVREHLARQAAVGGAEQT